jgi:uncharacterized Rossmann fold enzyme
MTSVHVILALRSKAEGIVVTSSDRLDRKVLFATGVADGDRAAAVAALLDASVGVSCEATAVRA